MKSQLKSMDYELYHDESQIGGYWHGMLLVPKCRKELLLEYLRIIRINTEYSDPIGIKKIKKHNRVFDCAEAWVSVAVAALQSRTKGKSLPIYLGKRNRGNREYSLFKNRIGAKFILFCERGNLSQMVGHSDYGSKVEATFRIGLKGGLHFLGDENDPIRIELIHFDGYEHYRRHINRNRVVGRLSGLKEYCEVSSDIELIDDRSGNHNRHDSQQYDDCQILQLTDLLIGCFRSSLRQPTNPLHISIAYPVKSIIDRYLMGFARMKNSRWWKSFCMSECYLDSGSWKFNALNYEKNQKSIQINLNID